MKKDISKGSLLEQEGQKAVIGETAKSRITNIQIAVADLFAKSIIACKNPPSEITNILWEAQETFFSRICQILPINTYIQMKQKKL